MLGVPSVLAIARILGFAVIVVRADASLTPSRLRGTTLVVATVEENTLPAVLVRACSNASGCPAAICWGVCWECLAVTTAFIIVLGYFTLDPLSRKVRTCLAVEVVDLRAQARTFHGRVLSVPSVEKRARQAQAHMHRRHKACDQIRWLRF